jgi:hypothetical protein
LTNAVEYVIIGIPRGERGLPPMVESENKKMNVIVFDTETTNLQKPFCYNVGYVIYNTDERKVLLARDYVIEQVWHNPMLFTTAYYADKREIYVSRMRGKTATLDKWGYVCQRMYRDIVEFEVKDGYAYNSKFDEGVFEFNSDWFKTINPLDTIAVHDIRGYVGEFLVDDNYKAYCEEKQLFTESGNYSTTAEAVFRYITDNDEFVEEHTALADSRIECDILAECVSRGAEWNTDYTVPRMIPRVTEKVYTVIDRYGNRHEFEYTSKRAISKADGVRLTYKK